MPEFMWDFLASLLVTYDIEAIKWEITPVTDPDFAHTMNEAGSFKMLFERHVDMVSYSF